jgi:hypothetical protein
MRFLKEVLKGDKLVRLDLIHRLSRRENSRGLMYLDMKSLRSHTSTSRSLTGTLTLRTTSLIIAMKMPSGLLLERNPQVDSLSFTY